MKGDRGGRSGKKTLRLELGEMILWATDPCKIHVFLGFLYTKQISNWRWLSSYYIPNCTCFLYWVTSTSNYMEHLSIWKSIEIIESTYELHTMRTCSINHEALYNHQMWLSPVTTVCLLVLIWIYSDWHLNYDVNPLGINFPQKLQEKKHLVCSWFFWGMDTSCVPAGH